MLEAKLVQGSVLRKVTDSIRDLVSTVKFEFSSTGMTLHTMDSAHVILIAMLLRADGFENYRCDRTVPIGLDLATFSKIIRTVSNDDSVTLRADDLGEALAISLDGASSGRSSEYELRLKDVQAEEMLLPDGEYDVSVKMPSEELQRICRDLSILGDSVVVDATKDSIRFSVKGELGNGSVSLRSTESLDSKEANSTSVHLRKPTSLNVSLKFLSNFTKATPLSDTVRLEFTKDLPMLVEYPIGDMGFLRFYLAPKVDDDMTDE